ncbi:MAG: sulfite exporter TauE/SafE family protein [Campylobacteraceae bacterium]|nr:sulfite exporter TauE/SafE family protein [Campylobacteraceae bacterium]
MTIVLFAIFGTFVGIVSGFFGIGGGSVVVPTLLMMGYDIKAAVGMSIMQMVLSSMFGSVMNYRAGKLELNEGIIVGIGGLVGASFSGFVVRNIPNIYLEIGLTLILFISIVKFFVAQPQAEKQIDSKLLLFIIGVFIGVVGVSMGIGGGVLLTPILVGFLGYDVKKAVSMGLFFVMFSSISGFISMSLNGLVDYKYGFLLGVGSLVGVYFGVKMAHRVERGLQKKLLLALYIILFVGMLSEILI